MLIRLACAIKEKAIRSNLETRMADLDIQLRFFKSHQFSWQALARSCSDIFIVSSALIPKPVESSIALLNDLPENPITIVLHNKESSEEQAKLLASGIDVVLYTGIPVDSLVEAIESTLDSRRQYYYADRFDQRGRFLPRLNDFTSNSREMQLFLEETRQIVSSDASVLLLGETGVGKEHLSKAIHAESHRSSGPFIAINVAAIPESLLESELFGHEQGAFTGAVRSRRGAFEMAHGGTIFLDEIGEMPLQMQIKLLRVLQELEFFPVGAEKPVWVDIRVIAATNKDLEAEIERGNFRKDLYYRLGVITLTLPPLRNRKEDIPSMANHFLTMYNQKIGQAIKQFSQEAMQALVAYHWPGNIRELMNVIERAILLCKTDTISLDDLPNVLYRQPPIPFSLAPASNLPDPESWDGMTLPRVREAMVAWVEKHYLEMVLKKTRGRIGEAAKIAGIHPRGLYAKMRKLGIDKADFKPKRVSS
jgi:two-component system, NtrC family, response regulator AtoC